MNKVILIGNLGKDVELRYTPSGAAVATFSLATSERYKDRDGNRQEKTEWHNIVVWRQTAEICSKFLKKGSKVGLEGKIQTRSYDDRDGNKRYITEIVADKVEFISGLQDANQGQQQQAYGQQQQGQSQPSGGGGYEPPFNDDDEIPF